MSSDQSNPSNQDNGEGSSKDTPSSGRGRNLSESSDPGSKRQRTLSESFFPGLTSASPPKFVPLEEIIAAANGITNMALAHEIAVDNSFQLEKKEPQENSIHKKIKETMMKAFWDILREELNDDPPVFTQALVLLSDVKQMLLSLLLPHNTKMKEEINEVLDSELIQQQLENGALDFPYYANYVTSMMAKLCSPVRDENIRKLKEETDTVAVFKGILETLELMKLDMANFTIRMSRPLVVASSVDYEKTKFKEFLKVNPDGLAKTTVWLQRHIPTSGTLSQDSYKDVIAQAYLELLTWDDANPFPETLTMDQGRLSDLRSEVLRVTVAAAILLLVVSAVPPLQTRPDFKVQFKDHLLLLLQDVTTNKDVEEVVGNMAVQATEECNKALGQPLSEEVQSAVSDQVTQVTSEDHRIRRLVFQRIKEFLHAMITSSVPSQIQVPVGLSAFTKELSSLAARYHRIISYNRNVFGEFYIEILDTVAGSQTQLNGV